MLYHIRWTSRATGFGTGLYPFDEAKRYAEFLNGKKDAICIHHPEPHIKIDEGKRPANK